MKKKEAKKTFTYASIPSAVNKAQQRAIKNNTTLSELIDEFVQGYAYPKKKIKGSVPLPADFLKIKSIGLLDSEGNVRLLETNSTQAYWPAIIKERIKQLKGE